MSDYKQKYLKYKKKYLDLKEQSGGEKSKKIILKYSLNCKDSKSNEIKIDIIVEETTYYLKEPTYEHKIKILNDNAGTLYNNLILDLIEKVDDTVHTENPSPFCYKLHFKDNIMIDTFDVYEAENGIDYTNDKQEEKKFEEIIKNENYYFNYIM